MRMQFRLREEKKAAQEAGAGISEQRHEAALATAGAGMGGQEEEHERRVGREKERMDADEVVKSSTDKLSAVFDWMIESTPAKAALSPFASLSSGSKTGEEGREKDEARARAKSTKPAERRDLATKMDLERFYVALCKKLYDEGL